MKPYYLYIFTPLLGLLRNYVKYKQITLDIFLRTPIAYFYIHLLLFMYQSSNIIYKTLIFERWFWFLFKTCKSYINNDYIRKQNKYKIKYNLEYEDNTSTSVGSIVSGMLEEE